MPETPNPKTAVGTGSSRRAQDDVQGLVSAVQALLMDDAGDLSSFDRAHLTAALDAIEAAPPPVLPADEERPEDAARRFAGELERLSTSLVGRGIPLRDGPVDGAGVDTALAELDRLRRYIETRDQTAPAPQPSYRAFLGERPCGKPGCPCGTVA